MTIRLSGMQSLGIVRALQALFAFLVFVLSCVAADRLVGWSAVNFMVFAGLWAMLSLAYIVISARFMPNYHSPLVVVVLEVLNVIFFFAGFIAVAVGANQSRCDLVWGRRQSACRSAKAVAAFGAISWLLWCISLYFMFTKHTANLGSSPRKASARRDVENVNKPAAPAADQQPAGTDTQPQAAPENQPAQT